MLESVIVTGFIPLAVVGLKLIFPAVPTVHGVSLHTKACACVSDKIVPLDSEAETALINELNKNKFINKKLEEIIFLDSIFN